MPLGEIYKVEGELTEEEKQLHDEIFRENQEKTLTKKQAVGMTKEFWKSLQITEGEEGGKHLMLMYHAILEYLENSERITN